MMHLQELQTLKLFNKAIIQLAFLEIVIIMVLLG